MIRLAAGVAAVATVGVVCLAVLLVGVPLLALAPVRATTTIPTTPTTSTNTTPTALATATVPAPYLVLYRQAATTCPGLPWAVLAAIGTVESRNGGSTLPGVHAGANAAGAEGPMQFEPDSFAAYAYPVPPGGERPPTPYDPADAIYAAARYLCANGAAGGADLPGAVYAYNHAGWYVREVLALADRLGRAHPAASLSRATRSAGRPGRPGSARRAAAPHRPGAVRRRPPPGPRYPASTR